MFVGPMGIRNTKRKITINNKNVGRSFPRVAGGGWRVTVGGWRVAGGG